MRGPGLGDFLIKVYPVDTFGFVKILLEADFINDPERNQDAGRDPNGQSQYIDESVGLLPEGISQGNSQIANKHHSLNELKKIPWVYTDLLKNWRKNWHPFPSPNLS